MKTIELFTESGALPYNDGLELGMEQQTES